MLSIFFGYKGVKRNKKVKLNKCVMKVHDVKETYEISVRPRIYFLDFYTVN
jgi:hypothetical protein